MKTKAKKILSILLTLCMLLLIVPIMATTASADSPVLAQPSADNEYTFELEDPDNYQFMWYKYNKVYLTEGDISFGYGTIEGNVFSSDDYGYFLVSDNELGTLYFETTVKLYDEDGAALSDKNGVQYTEAYEILLMTDDEDAFATKIYYLEKDDTEYYGAAPWLSTGDQELDGIYFCEAVNCDDEEIVYTSDWVSMTTYAITDGTAEDAHGSIDFDSNLENWVEYAPAEATIIVNVTPAEGYELDTIYVNGTAIDGNTFTMPADNVTVSATFKQNIPAEVEGAGYYASLTLNNNIDVNFKMKELGEGFTQSKLEITVDGDAVDFTYVDGVVSAILKAVEPKDIGKALTVVVKYDGVAVKSFDYSVASYCNEIFALQSYGVDSKLGELCKALLNYGKYAEDFAKKNTESTVNDGYEIDFTTVTIPTAPSTGFKAGTAVTNAQASLTLESEMSLNFYVYTTGTVDKENILIINDMATPTKVADENITLTAIEGGYEISVTGIGASKLSRIYTLTIKGIKDFSLTYGVNSYGYTVTNMETDETYTDTLKTLCKAIYTYGEAAKAYNESK